VIFPRSRCPAGHESGLFSEKFFGETSGSRAPLSTCLFMHITGIDVSSDVWTPADGWGKGWQTPPSKHARSPKTGLRVAPAGLCLLCRSGLQRLAGSAPGVTCGRRGAEAICVTQFSTSQNCTNRASDKVWIPESVRAAVERQIGKAKWD
jgi:hypothetical protein